MKKRTVFFLSDRTGITSETLGLSLISQFEGIHFNHVTLPFIDSLEKAQASLIRIEEAHLNDNVKPLVFATIINPHIRNALQSCNAYYIDYFTTFIPGLEKELGMLSANVAGRIHSATDHQLYNTRIEAVNFALNYDDGSLTRDYHTADVILIGVSRCGKTPTSLYLAMQFGIRAANYPLTEEDLHNFSLPKALQPYHTKLFGLTIDPKRLHAIRSSRKPNSRYATSLQCAQEVKAVEALFYQEKIPYLNSTNLSIEELATKLIAITGIERKLR